MNFPNKKYPNIKSFKNDYFKSLSLTFNSINELNLVKIIQLLEKSYKKNGIKINAAINAYIFFSLCFFL